MRPSSLLLAAALAITPASAALAGSDQTEPVVLFGKLPLGGKMKRPKTCPDLADAKEVCWVSAPRLLQGNRIGSVLLPDAAKPAWARYADFELFLRGDELGWVDVRDIKPEKMHAAVASISQRFGQPNDLSLSRSDVKWAEWRRPELHIKMACDPTYCTLRFSSAKEHAEHERYLASQKAKDAARPASP